MRPYRSQQGFLYVAASPTEVGLAGIPMGASRPYMGDSSLVSYMDESRESPRGASRPYTGDTTSVPYMDGSRGFCRAANRPYKGDPSSVSYGGESSLGLPADPIGPIPAEIPHERRQGSGTSDGAGATCSRRALPPARPAAAPAAAPPPPPPRPPPSWLRARPFRYRGRGRGGGSEMAAAAAARRRAAGEGQRGRGRSKGDPSFSTLRRAAAAPRGCSAEG